MVFWKKKNYNMAFIRFRKLYEHNSISIVFSDILKDHLFHLVQKSFYGVLKTVPLKKDSFTPD